VNESEWLASDDPVRMLRHLTHDKYRGGHHLTLLPRAAPLASDRKLRLFACACCRLAKGVRPADIDEWEAAGHPGLRHNLEPDRCWAEVWARPEGSAEAAVPSRPVRAALLRCLVGNPWRPAQAISYQLSAISQTAERLARSLYDARDWAALPVLADALEEAGCLAEESCPGCQGVGGFWGPPGAFGRPSRRAACPQCGGSGCVPNPLLAHLRGPGPHARGCWVLDLLLGKG
jgi:hypothetical protein